MDEVKNERARVSQWLTDDKWNSILQIGGVPLPSPISAQAIRDKLLSRGSFDDTMCQVYCSMMQVNVLYLREFTREGVFARAAVTFSSYSTDPKALVIMRHRNSEHGGHFETVVANVQDIYIATSKPSFLAIQSGSMRFLLLFLTRRYFTSASVSVAFYTHG
jgi:hypothetical protein